MTTLAMNLDRISRFSGLEGWRLLNDKGIEEALDAGRIQISQFDRRNQIQPASLDVRIGNAKVFDDEYRRRQAEIMEGISFPDIDLYESEEGSKRYEDGQDIIIPSRAFMDAGIHEELLHQGYDLEAELRSGMGRRGLELQSHRVFSGRMVYLWNWNPNPILLHGRSRFLQIFFHPRTGDVPSNGYVVSDEEEARELGRRVCDEPEFMHHYLLFRLGPRMLCFKENLGVLDTEEDYDDDFLYHEMRTKDRPVIRPEDAVIAELTPRLSLPADIGIRILCNIPYRQMSQGHIRPTSEDLFLEGNAARAAWGDPGYQGPVTAHPRPTKFAIKVDEGIPFALGIFYKYTEPCRRAYGSEGLGSHYTKGEISASS